MLSRASRNAYSWWWASHIRTKQSKWLDQNIQDMEEKVEHILKIITEDGDSFRVRAEQYYSKRPELVNFVEDTFREYRSLAERYDLLSRDLQSANRTIATVFPEKVQMSFDDDEYEDFTSNFDEDEIKVPTNSNVPLPLPMPPKRNQNPKMENVVEAMLKKKSKMPTKIMSKRGLIKIGVDEKVSKSCELSKEEAVEEINKLQKDILGFQTEKEFVKSSYEDTLSKYWEIDNNINEMHAKISDLQHEFGAGEMIEDKDAQTLMSSSALKICKETLVKMKNKHKHFKKEAIVQHKRVDEIMKNSEALIACNKSKSNFRETTEHVMDKKEKIEMKDMKSVDNSKEDQIEKSIEKEKEDEEMRDRKSRIKEEIFGKDDGAITISTVAERIEQLVEKVINLETEVISQAALIMRLKFENDELDEHLESPEQEKRILVEDSIIKIKSLEENLKIIQILDHKIKEQNSHLESSFGEVSVSLDSLSNQVLIAKPDEKIQEDVIFHDGINTQFPKLETNNGITSYKSHHSEEKAVRKSKIEDNDDLENFVDESVKKEEIDTDESQDIKKEESHHSEEKVVKENKMKDNDELEDFVNESVKKEGIESRDIKAEERHDQTFFETTMRKEENVDFILEPNWKLILSHEIEDRERMLIEEYTSTLKNYKQVKKKLNETEKRNRATSFRSAVQMKMLRSSNESKDSEIRSLYEKLKLFETESLNFQVSKTSNLATHDNIVDIEAHTYLDNQVKANNADLIDESTQAEDELDDIEYELKKASDAIDEGTHRIKELIENAHSELKKAQGLVEGGTQETNEVGQNEATKSSGERKQRRKKLGDEDLDIEEEIRCEIDDLRKENLEVWLRFSTSYHQINRFQDSYNDLLEEIKQVKEKKHEHESNKHHHVSSDVRPLYRQLRDMHTEVILWLEKSGILEDDLQHRLTSLSDIQDEISEITTSNQYSNDEKTKTTPLGDHQAAKFQGEVLNMKQENANVLDELRIASERVKTLQADLETTLSQEDAQLGKMKKSNSSLKVPFRSFLFGAKLKRKHRSSLFKSMSPSLRRHRSNTQQQSSSQPRQDS